MTMGYAMRRPYSNSDSVYIRIYKRMAAEIRNGRVHRVCVKPLCTVQAKSLATRTLLLRITHIVRAARVAKSSVLIFEIIINGRNSSSWKIQWLENWKIKIKCTKYRRREIIPLQWVQRSSTILQYCHRSSFTELCCWKYHQSSIHGTNCYYLHEMQNKSWLTDTEHHFWNLQLFTNIMTNIVCPYL